MPYNKLTAKHLNRLKDRIKETFLIKNLNDTGGAVNSLEVIESENALVGNDYIYFLDQGRRPGSFPPVDNIREWVRNKLNVSDKEVNGVAYVVGRKIANEGTEIYKDKSKGLQLDDLIEDMLKNLYADIPNEVEIEAKKFLDI